MRRPVLALGIALVGVALGACKRPGEAHRDAAPAASSAAVAPPSASSIPRGTERLHVVTADAAPLLPEIEPEQGASQVLHAGDLVHVDRELVPLKWKGAMDGVVATREGPMVAVRRADGDAPVYGFKSDLGAAVEAPDTPWLCTKMERVDVPATARDVCTARLRRARLPDGGVVAYVNCSTGPCPVAIARGDAVETITVDGVIDARLAKIGGRPVLMQNARWVREAGTWTGGEIVTVTLDGPKPVVAARIPADEIDARGPKLVVQRNVTLDYGDADVHVTGELHTVDRETGKVTATKPIDERRALLGE